MLLKDALGTLSVILTAVSYFPYIWSIMRGRTRPHFFSWIIWATVNAIAFIGQYTRGGGAGAWTTGFTAALCLVVAVLSFFRGEKNITKGDWIALLGAMMAILWWSVTNDPLGAVILATAIDVVGCYPTARKSYQKPHEENLFSWVIASLRSGISLFAIGKYNAVTMIFPMASIFTNGGMAALIVWRRRTKSV